MTREQLLPDRDEALVWHKPVRIPQPLLGESRGAEHRAPLEPVARCEPKELPRDRREYARHDHPTAIVPMASRIVIRRKSESAPRRIAMRWWRASRSWTTTSRSCSGRGRRSRGTRTGEEPRVHHARAVECERGHPAEPDPRGVTTRLARRFGTTASLPPAPGEMPVREIFAIARENAVEGCVRETYGAVIGLVEAATSSDPDVRRSSRRIAEDECRHAVRRRWSCARPETVLRACGLSNPERPGTESSGLAPMSSGHQ